jgi:GH25 family lysozyme M1 (1,4-beta-N-acetylmuramidase)
MLVLLPATLASLTSAAPAYAYSGQDRAPASTQGPRLPAAGGDPSLPHSTAFLDMLRGGRLSADAAAEGWPEGVDVSSSQHSDGARINWPQVFDSGIRFALIKATEGNYYVNPYFAGDYSTAKGSRLYAAGYHFAIPSASDGASQADFFLDTAADSGSRATLPPVVDLEWNPYDSSGPCYGLSSDSMVGWIRAFKAEVLRRAHRSPAIYTSASWWNQCAGGDSSFTGDPLWVAAYDVSEPAMPAGWSVWALWQYTSTGRIPGIEGEVDVSNFVGTQNDLPNFAGKPTAAPTPVARPE